MENCGTIWFLVGLLPVATLACGYQLGMADGMREARYLLDEQRREYERLREYVFVELGIEVDG